MEVSKKINLYDSSAKIILDVFGNDSIIKKDLNVNNDKDFFEILFLYKDFYIKISKHKDRIHDDIMDIELKEKIEGYSVDWLPFHLLLSYFLKEKYFYKYDEKKLYYYCIKLKGLIDNNKTMCSYSTMDYKKRFFKISDNVIDLPCMSNMDIDYLLIFKDQKEYMINNTPCYN